MLRILPELERSRHLVVQLASRAADSWYQRGHFAAAVLAERDDEMDELHASLTAELSSGRMALAVTIEMTLALNHQATSRQLPR